MKPLDNAAISVQDPTPHQTTGRFMLPLGFKYAGITCGIKDSGQLDLALISTETPSVIAGVYTQNVVRAASIDWNRSRTPSDSFRGLIINSGNANACTGDQGKTDNEQMAILVAEQLNASPDQICVLSTGVIGDLLPMEKLAQGIPHATSVLSSDRVNFELASQAILTTDKAPKTIESALDLESGTIRLVGIAKGAGMIGPNMATMLAVLMTDADIPTNEAQTMLSVAADRSFNRISVEGHTSTNDALVMICSGKSGVKIQSDSDRQTFQSALDAVCINLAKQIPSDGEGASHLISIQIDGAPTDQDADTIARTIGSSPLVKTAITGADPNWGRIVSAAGYSRATIDLNRTSLKINGHSVFKNGQPVEFDASTVSQSMSQVFETKIQLTVGAGPGTSNHWTSDLTVEYVRFNSEYHT